MAPRLKKGNIRAVKVFLDHWWVKPKRSGVLSGGGVEGFGGSCLTELPRPDGAFRSRELLNDEVTRFEGIPPPAPLQTKRYCWGASLVCGVVRTTGVQLKSGARHSGFAQFLHLGVSPTGITHQGILA
jgi:hypothetical protein